MRDWVKLPTEDGGVLYADSRQATVSVDAGGQVRVDTPERFGVLLQEGIHVDIVVAALDGDEMARIMLDPATMGHKPTWRQRLRAKRRQRRPSTERDPWGGSPDSPSLPAAVKIIASVVATFTLLVFIVRACNGS